jgi:molybdate transport system permease protein
MGDRAGGNLSKVKQPRFKPGAPLSGTFSGRKFPIIDTPPRSVEKPCNIGEDIAVADFLAPAEWTAVLLSLRIAVVATVASLPFGIFIAYALARWRFPGKTLIAAVVYLPLVLPPVVTGYMLLIAFGRRGIFGEFLANLGIVFSFRWTGAALACAVMGFPLMVRAMRLSFEAIDPRLEQAAGTLGANPIVRFFLISVPLAMPGIVAGATLAFARSLGEFGATITFVSNIPGETQTIASAIYTFIQVPGGDAAALRLTLVAVAIAFAAIIVSEVIQRQGEKRLARSV